MFRLAPRRALAQASTRHIARPSVCASLHFRALASTSASGAKAQRKDVATTSRTRKPKVVSPPKDDAAEITAEIAEKNLAAVEEDSETAATHSETAATPITLRPYQEEAITACVKALEAGQRRIGVSSPTGSGKTTMFMNLIPRIPPRGEGSQVLILVGSVELALQAENAARALLPGYSVEVEQAKRVASGLADITIATYQTLNNPARLDKFDPSRFKLVIVDEAHHSAALSYLRLLHYFNEDVELPDLTGPISTFDHGQKVPIIGFSATFSRHDQLALRAVYEEIVFHRDVSEMLQDGWLAPVKSTAVYADLNLDDVAVTAGDYRKESLARHVNTPEVNTLIVRTWLYRAKERRSTLVFAVDLKHVADLVQTFKIAGVDARSISSKTRRAERLATLEAFKRGEFPVLVNCEVLTEGADVPEIDCIILARPTQSLNLVAQMVGRGLRLSPSTGKADCYLLDIVDNVSGSLGMKVAPTLFGWSHDDLPVDEGRNEAQKELETPESSEASSPSESIYSVTLVDCDDPFALATPASTFVVMEKLSANAWVHCGNGKYILEMIGYGFITVQPSEELFSVTFTPKLPAELRKTSPYMRKQQIAYAETMERAFNTADTFAEKRMGRERFHQLRRSAAWRHRPASPKQTQLLKRIKGLTDGDGTVTVKGMGISLDDVNAGQVASLLCAAQHGALTLRQKAQRAATKAAEKERKLRDKQAALEARNLPLPP